jgi:hypothetical protein
VTEEQNGQEEQQREEKEREEKHSTTDTKDAGEADQTEAAMIPFSPPASRRRPAAQAPSSASLSVSSSPRKGKKGWSVQEPQLVALVDAMQSWKSSTAKDSILKTLRQAAALLSDYRSSQTSATPIDIEIPAADKPLLKIIAKALVQKSILHSKADEVRIT